MLGAIPLSFSTYTSTIFAIIFVTNASVVVLPITLAVAQHGVVFLVRHFL
jgi:hypothetical protein